MRQRHCVQNGQVLGVASDPASPPTSFNEGCTKYNHPKETDWMSVPLPGPPHQGTRQEAREGLPLQRRELDPEGLTAS